MLHVDAAVVRGDAVLSGTLLGNGIGNALQHANHVVVDVAAYNDVATIVVHDDGPGIAAADRVAALPPSFRPLKADNNVVAVTASASPSSPTSPGSTVALRHSSTATSARSCSWCLARGERVHQCNDQ